MQMLVEFIDASAGSKVEVSVYESTGERIFHDVYAFGVNASPTLRLADISADEVIRAMKYGMTPPAYRPFIGDILYKIMDMYPDAEVIYSGYDMIHGCEMTDSQVDEIRRNVYDWMR